MSLDSTTKRKAGRPKKTWARGKPSKYTPEMCQRLIDHMAQGNPFASFCADVGISRKTLYRWMESHPEFAEAKAIAQDKAIAYHWETLKLIAKDASGRNAVSVIYMLKCLGFADDQELRELQKKKLQKEVEALENGSGLNINWDVLPPAQRRKAFALLTQLNEIIKPYMAAAS